MKLTLNCDAANKMVKSLTADRNALLRQEREGTTFVATAATLEDDRPNYEFGAVQKELAAINQKIFALKHAINRFNVNTVLSAGYTVDEALVRMSILSQDKSRFDSMRTQPEKSRTYNTRLSAEPEYTFRNYRAEDAEEAYRKVEKELTELQQALNIANLTIPFEVELP